jgi:hypothetical protein
MTRRPKKEPKRKPEPIARFRMSVNDLSVSGEKYDDGWHWLTSPELLDLGKKYDRCDDFSPMLDEFVRRALAGGD